MSTTTAEHVTIEDARATFARARDDYRAGRIDNDAAGRAFDTFEATVKQLDAAHVIEGCPDWCNDHEFEHGVTAAEDVSSHRRTVKGQGWSFEVSEAYRESGRYEVMSWIDNGLCDSLPIEDARAHAAAILETIDTVTGATR